MPSDRLSGITGITQTVYWGAGPREPGAAPSMPDSMIERMKTAVVAECQRQASEEGCEWAGDIDYGTMESVNGRACLVGEFHIEKIVRAVLAVMRAPTRAMAAAAPSCYGDDDWPAMIDAALAEAPCGS